MSKATETLIEVQKFAMATRPKVGGFPHLAECLRMAGVTRNLWTLPSCQSVYLTKFGDVVMQGTPLVVDTVEIPKFDGEALVRALRRDQAGEGTFPEFIRDSWAAGVVSYDVDFEKRMVTYYGARGETYNEQYSAVDVKR